MTMQISCNWVNKGVTSLSLKGDDAPLNCKHRYLLWASTAAFQTCVNTNPAGTTCWLTTMPTLVRLTDELLNTEVAATSTKWLKEVQASLPFTGLSHAAPAPGGEPAHESCITTSWYPATETAWQHSSIETCGRYTCAETPTHRR